MAMAGTFAQLVWRAVKLGCLLVQSFGPALHYRCQGAILGTSYMHLGMCMSSSKQDMQQTRESILLVGISGSVDFYNPFWSKEICEEVSCLCCL